jgi:hypothetical protein
VATAELPTQLPSEANSTVLKLLPHGQHFTTPVTVTLAYKNAEFIPSGYLRVMRLADEQDNEWEVVPEASFVNGVATFKTNTFSYYTVVVYPEPVCDGTTEVTCKCEAGSFCAADGACLPLALDTVCKSGGFYTLHNAYPSDNLVADSVSAILGKYCGVEAKVIDQSDASVIDQCSGAPLLGMGNTVVMAGGFFTQYAARYFDRTLSPVYLDRDVSETADVSAPNQIKSRSGKVLHSYPDSDVSTTSDYFVIQLLADPSRGALFVHLYGHGNMGTAAASWYFQNSLLPSHSRDWTSFVVVHWVDGNGDGLAGDGDKFDVVAAE